MSATIPLPLLSQVRIASPCHVKWEDMKGDDKVRHCDSCDLNVHNFSAMTTPEAELFLADYFNPDGSSKGHRLCAGMFRRPDGTVIMQDCPVGVARLAAAARRSAARVAAAIGLVSLAGWLTSQAAASDASLTQYEPFASLTKVMKYAGITPRQQQAQFLGGIVCPAPLPPQPAPAPAPVQGTAQ